MPEQKNPRYQEDKLGCSCGCGGKGISPGLVALLELVYERFGKYIHINSGYRCAKHNKEVGGEPNSYHMKGLAADIWIEGVSPDIVWGFCNEHIDKGGGGGDNSFTHIDARGYKARWD